ncbi:mannose-1-phosphate guanylyltransferase/mannose-6-phosphate isomerase [Neptunomonas sp. XY-337]|uniref:mannose-1-phosphate guanylyltransferase/mannose-6-phosphate isomerase n=1 Tax=Neptunomonas sp. XY-337 TaxID=2561897 RepID=UPI0010AA0D6A|nr:mannose-1-phosphate guanylyltransferase/mannose-6-phosphate isomerase [Neptunomonas sp. XY-337]
MIPVVLCGGSGTRLWPMSRAQYPKQFLSLNSDKTMLQETIDRLEGMQEGLVICNEEHRFLVAEQLRHTAIQADILLEPVGRNTAPAIALAALQLEAAGRASELMLVLPADHVFQNTHELNRVVQLAAPVANDGQLVTFGIVPHYPETGFGYIKRGGELDADSVYQVAQFVEKPELATAQAYVDSGEYYWNSGMFLFRVDRYLEELAKHSPQILASCREAMQATQADLDFIRVDTASFQSCPDDSIDYAVMEKTDAAAVIPLDAGWSDVGSWSALWDLKEKDANGNVLTGDVLTESTNNTLVVSQERLVTTLGIEDLIIVDTKDAVLVAHKDRIQDVKKLVAQIKTAGRNEHQQHREVYRPWGCYDTIDLGERYQVKRITVNPGGRLSLQMHHHRAEHWIVVSGTAKVTNGEREFLLQENESTYIPAGEKHRLENPGKIPLEMIEVQSGTYLGEDDIVRFDDKYGRAE